MSRQGLVSTVVTLLLAAAPATAFADGAGDDQYQDPLAAPQTQTQSAPAPTPTQTATTTAPSSTVAGTSASGSSGSSAAASQNELPRTGAPAGLVALIGATMLGSGLALRRRIAE